LWKWLALVTASFSWAVVGLVAWNALIMSLSLFAIVNGKDGVTRLSSFALYDAHLALGGFHKAREVDEID